GVRYREELAEDVEAGGVAGVPVLDDGKARRRHRAEGAQGRESGSDALGEVAEPAGRNRRAGGEGERLGQGTEAPGAGGGRGAGVVGEPSEPGGEARASRRDGALGTDRVVDAELELDELGDGGERRDVARGSTGEVEDLAALGRHPGGELSA